MPRLCWSLLFLLTACTQSTERSAPPPSSAASPAPLTRVLFIGNSYTEQNNLPGMVEAFARALAPESPFETESSLTGGATLRWHQTQGAASRRIREGSWNYVVLQEQSLLGGLRVDGITYVADPETLFFPTAREFSAQISAVGARPLFYMTWSRKANLAAQGHLTQAYTHISRELGAELAPVGLAWERVRRERPELELYDTDGHHPGPAGTYLAACVLFSSIFHKPCMGAPSTLPRLPRKGFDFFRSEKLVSLPEETAHYLQRVGSEVALAAPPPVDMASVPARPSLPSLPPGEFLHSSQLTGAWSGSLALYPVEEHMSPATLHLELAARGAELTGNARITFPRGGAAKASVSPLVREGELSFDIHDAAFLESTVRFRAILKEGTLQGVAFAEDPRGGRWHGSWSARSSSPGGKQP